MTADRARARAERLHRTSFTSEPTAHGAASGRVNLIGDHVDYAGGCVLPMALAEATHAVGSSAPGGDDQFVSEWSEDPQWTRYAAGVLAELRAAGVVVPPVRIAVAGDVPVGAGLSSSASLEIAVARCALACAGATLDAGTLALLCQRAEHVHAGTPCGIMDQWCIAHAAPGEAILLDCTTRAWKAIALPGELDIAIVDSGVRHALRDGGYAARRADVEEAARLLGVERLADFPAERVAELDRLPPRLTRRARHVVTECARVRAAVEALACGDSERFGSLLVESHASLRDDFDVSTPEIDAIVARVLDAGALGARMTGGGFGGSVVIAWRRRS